MPIENVHYLSETNDSLNTMTFLWGIETLKWVEFSHNISLIQNTCIEI